jgi:hypothetical protein
MPVDKMPMQGRLARIRRMWHGRPAPVSAKISVASLEIVTLPKTWVMLQGIAKTQR